MISKDIIYILGAGRSGSTVLATVLNNHDEISYVGELHHFFSYVKNDDFCSCGQPVSTCEYWNRILDNLPDSFKRSPGEYERLCNQMEYHTAVPFHLTGLKRGEKFSEYRYVQRELMNAISDQENSSKYILDSAKYIGRFLALRKIFKNNVKGIFLIRDLRAVIFSFKKKVQTQNPPFKTFIYYVTINSLAQLLSILPGFCILKIRYEDVVDDPIITFHRIGTFLELDLNNCVKKIEEQKPFNIPHIIGGNRLKKSSLITIKKDEKWVKTMPLYKKIFFYISALPLMMINNYKFLK